MIKVINGNSIEELKKFPDNYFGSVVTDPPYGLSFMGKKWDYDVPSVELWKEVFRVLKEGGHLLAFAGTRTQHRMAVNIEDAGFEIRDMIAWVYGSGFPKSHNIALAIDKQNGVIGNRGTAINVSGKGTRKDIKTSVSKTNNTLKEGYVSKNEWNGWGTALKPALEPITMARKPFKTSVAENVLKNGVGGINIDGCRVGNIIQDTSNNRRSEKSHKKTIFKSGLKNDSKGEITQGRFPANFIHDGSDEVTDLFPKNAGGGNHKYHKKPTANGMFNLKGQNNQNGEIGYKDSGSASRFFYCAKASKQDRNEGLEDFEDKRKAGEYCLSYHEGKKRIDNSKKVKNIHPTVKPTDLMRYLVRLVTPKNEIVLDCFMGSGSTGKACALEGLSFVGIDLDKGYCEIAKARIDKALEDKRIMDSQLKIF